MQKLNNNIHIKEIDINTITDDEKNLLKTFENKLDKTQAKLDPITQNLLKTNQQTIDQELKIYQQENCKLFYLYDKIKLIGFILSCPVKTIPGFYNVHQLYLEPEYRGKQLGKYFLLEVIKIMKEKYRANIVGLEAINKNKIAMNLYKSLGFIPMSTYFRKEI